METTFTIWVGSDFKVMPRTGGLDDQDPHWVTDMALCLRLREFQRQAQKTYSESLKDDLARRQARQGPLGNGRRH